jgi:hypothetical protein
LNRLEGQSALLCEGGYGAEREVMPASLNLFSLRIERRLLPLARTDHTAPAIEKQGRYRFPQLQNYGGILSN